MTLAELRLEVRNREQIRLDQIARHTEGGTKEPKFPDYNLEQLTTRAKQLIKDEGGVPDALLVYKLVGRLRNEEMRNYRDAYKAFRNEEHLHDHPRHDTVVD